MSTVEIYSADWIVPVDGPPVAQGAIVVGDDGRIVEIRADRGSSTAPRHEFPGAAIVPGFVNAHSHLEYAAFSGFGDGLPFAPWLDLHIARKRCLGEDGLLASARLGAVQSLTSGITTVADSAFSGAAASACREVGLRGIVHIEVFGSDPAAVSERFESMRERCRGSSLVQPGIAPHAPYSASAAVYRAAVELGVPCATHLAESAAEQEFMLNGTGPIEKVAAMTRVQSPGVSSVRHLASERAISTTTTAAHCVHVDDDEIASLAQLDVGVAHCPRSNALLGCGVAPLTRLRDAGLRVGLGTDSPASALNFDMFAEMRTAVAFARAAARRPDALSASDVLRLATAGSADAIGLSDVVGTLTPGKQADLAIIDIADTNFVPVEDISAAIVYGGSPRHVSRTIVGGRTRYRRGGSGWPGLQGAARSARRSMLGRAARDAT
ncbi:MAG: amidohydrolase family protein [Gaiellales bacterium]